MSVDAGPAGQTPLPAGDYLMDPSMKLTSIFEDPAPEPLLPNTHTYLVCLVSSDAQTPCLCTLHLLFRVLTQLLSKGKPALHPDLMDLFFSHFINVHLDREEIALAKLSARFSRIFQNQSIMGLRKY